MASDFAPGEPLVALVLAGGASRRMGCDKAWIDWDGTPLLVRVVGRLTGLARARPLVVARPGQELPPGSYRRVDDQRPGEGPLAGLAVGLAAIAARGAGRRVAVCACDYPFADPAVFRALAARDAAADVVAPFADGHLHPLHAVWRADRSEACAYRLARGERRVTAALAGARVRYVRVGALGLANGERGLLNVNDAAGLARARSAAPGP